MIPVEHVRPLAPYIGGKSKLAKTIIKHINAIPHKAYCEAFVGMGGIFFRRKSRPKAEFINDFNGEVANFFRILNEHYQPFIDLIKWRITTRREFDRLMSVRPEMLTDMQRAARFLYLQKLVFGGKATTKSFGVDPTAGARLDLSKLVPLLEDAHERLSGVVIENLDYKEFIRRYDREGTLFYLDPPYYGSENDYGHGLFAREEFGLMADLLKGIKGTFILSLNDRKEVRKLFKGFHLLPVSTTYSIAEKGSHKRVGELLISNMPLSDK
jgi:DNA adenine methylase